MEPTKPQMATVHSLAEKRASKEEQHEAGAKMWGPQHAGVVKKFDKDKK